MLMLEHIYAGILSFCICQYDLFVFKQHIRFYFVGNTPSIHILESLCNLDEIIRSIKLCDIGL